MDKAIRILYSGVVQGVGFRFTARHLSNRYRIKGWVRNTVDGKVELIAQAEDESLKDFLSDLKEEFADKLTDIQTEEIEPDESYDDFQVKF